MDIFQNTSTNQYFDKYFAVKAEDAGEEFFTRDEVQAITQSKYFQSYVTDMHWTKMKRALSKLAKSVEEGKKSIALPEDLEIAIKDEWQISNYLKEKTWRVNNGRLYVAPPAQRTVRISDYKFIKSSACSLLRQKGVDLQFIHTSKKDEVIRVLKKLVTWKEVAADIIDDYYYERNHHDIKWMKKLWLDPTIMTGK